MCKFVFDLSSSKVIEKEFDDDDPLFILRVRDGPLCETESQKSISEVSYSYEHSTRFDIWEAGIVKCVQTAYRMYNSDNDCALFLTILLSCNCRLGLHLSSRAHLDWDADQKMSRFWNDPLQQCLYSWWRSLHTQLVQYQECFCRKMALRDSVTS